MKIENENINDENKNEIIINSNENKQNNVIENNNKLENTNCGSILNYLTNEKIYSNIEIVNSLLKSYHKSIMKNIGIMVKNILKNSNMKKNEFMDLRKKIFEVNIDENSSAKEFEQYINILHKIELVHSNFKTNIKKIILKINRQNNKRKKKLNEYNTTNQNYLSIYSSLISKLNNQFKGKNININSYPLIINNIQNIINNAENKPNNLFENFNNEFLKIYKNNYFENLDIKKEYFFILNSKKSPLNKCNSFVITKNISNFKILAKDSPNTKITKEVKDEIKNYKDLLFQKDSEISELKNINKSFKEKISSLEKNIKKYSSENNQLKSELISIRKNKYTLEFKLKQNEKTISYLNKQNETATKLNKEEKMKYDNEIKNLNINLSKSNLENKKLYKNLYILEEENKKINQSFNVFNNTHTELNNLQQKYLNLKKLFKEIEQENNKNKSIIEKYKKTSCDFVINENNNNYDIIKENEKLRKELKEFDEKTEFLNKKLEEKNNENKCYKSSLINVEEKNNNLVKKYEEINIKLEEFQKSKYSSNTFRRSYKENDDINEITPNKYILVKYLEIEGTKWCLFKKKNNQISQRKHYYNRYQRFKTLSNNNESKDKNDEYIWKQVLNPNDFSKFGFLSKEKTNDFEVKINNLENNIKDLKEKLAKKEEDFNRININYAKLLKRSKNPENNQEKLLEEINCLKKENKILNNSLNKLKEGKNVIGISFIEDDLESSFFIENFSFDKVLEEMDKNEDKLMALNNELQKKYHPNYEKNIEDIKLENATTNF